MSDDAEKHIDREIIANERAAAHKTLAECHAALVSIGQDLKEKGACLIDEDVGGLLAVASQLQRIGLRLHTIAVEVNSAEATIRESLSDEARRRGIDIGGGYL